MTNQEFSNEFDVLYNNIMSNQAPGLDEYEKSVFLTKAQYEIIKNYFNPKGNKYQEGFDQNPKRQIDFSRLIAFSKMGKVANTEVSGTHFIDDSVRYYFPQDVFIVLNERIKVQRNNKDKWLTVIPISMSEFDRIMSKPFRYPLKNQAWRLLTSSDTSYVELVSAPYDNWERASYLIRYIKKPLPIILIPLSDSLSIDGYKGSIKTGGSIEYIKESDSKTPTDGISSELDKELHPEILQRAVELAKAAYVGDINSQVQMGQRSE